MANLEPVAIVGSLGFIGRRLQQQLEAKGYPVVGVDRGGLDDEASLAQIAKTSTIYWAASTINPAVAAADPSRVEADLGVFRNFLDMLDAANSAARVVLFSSGGTIYGKATPPFKEDSFAVPIAEYGKAKLLLEKELRSRQRSGVSIRISNVYGPGQYPAPGQGVIGHWLFAAAAEKPVQVIGSLEVIRDYVYIDDLVNALVSIIEKPELPQIINVGSGVPSTLEDVLAAVKNAVGSGLEIEASPSRAFDLDRVWLDCTRAEQALGWRAETSLDDGVRHTWEWVSGLAAHGGLSR